MLPLDEAKLSESDVVGEAAGDLVVEGPGRPRAASAMSDSMTDRPPALPRTEQFGDGPRWYSCTEPPQEESGNMSGPAELDDEHPPDPSENAEGKFRAAEAAAEGDPENAEAGGTPVAEVAEEGRKLPGCIVTRRGSAAGPPRAELVTSPSLTRVGIWKAVGAADKATA